MQEINPAQEILRQASVILKMRGERLQSTVGGSREDAVLAEILLTAASVCERQAER